MRLVLRISALAGMFLAFGWPLAVGTDPGSPAFRAFAIVTLIAFLGSIAAILVRKR